MATILPELDKWMSAVTSLAPDLRGKVLTELECRYDICCATKGAVIEYL
jgi:hypothetical protein